MPARKKARAKKQAAPEGWRPAEQEIFRYWDGSRDRAADPLALQRALSAHPDGSQESIDLELKILGGSSDTGKQLEALGNLAEVSRAVFKVPPFAEVDGGTVGLTDQAAVELLGYFFTYLAGLKKKVSPPLTSPPATDCPPAQSATPNTSASPSTSAASDASSPSPSPPASSGP